MQARVGDLQRAITCELGPEPVADCGSLTQEALTRNGPLEVQVKAKKARTQRARQKVNENERVRPEEVRGRGLSCLQPCPELTLDTATQLKAGDVEKDKNETGRLVKAVNSGDADMSRAAG